VCGFRGRPIGGLWGLPVVVIIIVVIIVVVPMVAAVLVLEWRSGE
jgi:hypothetical protein